MALFEQKTQDNNMLLKRKKYWKTRIIVSLLLLALSFIGILITAFVPGIAWHYWTIMIPGFAALCLWLSWLNADNHHLDGVTIWHEILHWVALLLAVYLVYFFVHAGIISNIMAGFFILVLLALTTFIAGIYIDSSFLSIGLTLGLLSIFTAKFIKYILIVGIPIIIVVAIILIWQHQKKKPVIPS